MENVGNNLSNSRVRRTNLIKRNIIKSNKAGGQALEHTLENAFQYLGVVKL